MLNNQSVRFFHSWLTQFCDPHKAIRAVRGLKWYLSECRRYSRLPGAEPVRLIDLSPQLHDRAPETQFDAHYFWMSGWAMRLILSTQPKTHVDVGSHNLFVNLLSAVLPVTFLDYRPLNVHLSGLRSLGGTILELPFAEKSIESLSCLHVAEHIGLGRYGDPLNPNGTRQACAELCRVLAQGGNLFFALPVGKPRLCFNSHRIHTAEMIRDYFSDLELMEFSGVHDDGRFVERVSLFEFKHSHYACGMFWFQKPINKD